jgi:indole-3-glycerol phosphate synthase
VILDKIVESTREAIARLKSQIPLSSMQELARNQDPPRDFADALNGQNVSLIAEVKRASPSKGQLCPDLDVSSLARLYSQSGASAISVLTEPEYFQGSFTDLETARAEVKLPVLCKDFIVDRYQVYKARAHGADAVLLITAILTQRELTTLLETTYSLGMAALVEVHNIGELDKALKCSPRIIGINNRDLTDFSIDLGTTLDLRPMIPSGTLVVSESGIHTRDDVLTLEKTNVNAVLVGEALVTSSDPAIKIRELLGYTSRASI